MLYSKLLYKIGHYFLDIQYVMLLFWSKFACEAQNISPCTVRPGSSDPPEKIFNIFASENEVYTIY